MATSIRMQDDIETSFSEVFPKDKRTRSYATKCLKLFQHLLPRVSCDKMPTFLLYFHDRIRAKYNTLTTVANIFSQVRQLVKQKRPECAKDTASVVRLTEQERTSLKKQSAGRIQASNSNVKRFQKRDIKHTIAAWQASTDPLDKIPLLMLQSGMRLIEVLRLARVSPGKDSGWIRTTHLAKNRTPQSQAMTVEKPLLYTTYAQFDRQLSDTRAFVKRSLGRHSHTMSNKEVTNHFDHAVNTRVRSALGGQLGSHIARKIYGALSYKKFGERSGLSLNAWLEKVLGHKSLTTSLSYSNVKVD